MEAVIQGDWKDAAGHLSILSFDGESAPYRDGMRERYERFHAILAQACADATKREAGKPIDRD